MSYTTGTAISFTALKSALIAACTADGWASPATDILSKGDCFVKLTVGANYLQADAGLGQSGGAITTPAPSVYCMDPVTDGTFAFPVTFAIHVVGSGVVMTALFASDRYMYLAFGQDPVAGLPGKGTWVSASNGVTAQQWLQFDSSGGTASNAAQGVLGTGPFTTNYSFSRNVNSYVHHGLDGGQWSGAQDANVNNNTPNSLAKAIGGMGQLMTRYSPNAWNSEAILVPIQPYIGRGSGKCSIIADIDIMRYIRIDNYTPGDIITLGAEKWRVYPYYKKDAANRISWGSGTNAIAHSGTHGYAVRYDGP